MLEVERSQQDDSGMGPVASGPLPLDSEDVVPQQARGEQLLLLVTHVLAQQGDEIRDVVPDDRSGRAGPRKRSTM